MHKRTPHNKLTQEKVIQQFKEVHGDAFDYSKVKYVDVQTPVEVYCKKHDFTFYPTPKNHKKGSKCTHCGRENQIEKAKEIAVLKQKKIILKKKDKVKETNKKDDYEILEVGDTDVVLFCKTHGEFKLKFDTYLKGSRCLICNSKKTKSNDKELFLEEAKKVYGEQHDYTNTEIIASKYKINVRCKKHNYIFNLSIGNYLGGQGCPKCAMINYNKIRAKSTEHFIKQAKEVHGDNCDYTDTIYQSVRKKVTIKCNKHNEYFTTLPVNHLAGGSCRTCLSENISKANTGKEGTCGYTRSGYVKQANGREAYVYVIKCFNEEEEFYKIGKTFLDINTRFRKANLPYSFELLHKHVGEAGYVYDKEIEMHKLLKERRYNPNIYFGGYTECFSIELTLEEIKNLLDSK